MVPKTKPLNRSNIRGHIFEVFVRILLEQNGWKIQSKGDPDKFSYSSPFWIELKGRGTWHQIDAPCIFERHIPFIYPLRLITEMKFLKAHKGEVQKDQMREFLGVVKDISENYFIDIDHTSDQERFTEVGTFFSANGFQQEAVNLGFAHGIRTVSYRTNKNIADIKKGIEDLVNLGFPPRTLIGGKGRLAKFKEDLYDYMSNRRSQLLQSSGWGNITEETRKTLASIRDSLNGIKANFIGTTSAGILLHFLGKDEFPNELFTETDTQPCRIYYDDSIRKDIPMWLEFRRDSKRPKRRFYFDIPPILEEVIKNEKDILSAKETAFAHIAVYKRINNIMRLLNLEIDKEWIDRIREHRTGG